MHQIDIIVILHAVANIHEYCVSDIVFLWFIFRYSRYLKLYSAEW
jgi:hypothetical protein